MHRGRTPPEERELLLEDHMAAAVGLALWMPHLGWSRRPCARLLNGPIAPRVLPDGYLATAVPEQHRARSAFQHQSLRPVANHEPPGLLLLTPPDNTVRSCHQHAGRLARCNLPSGHGLVSWPL